MERSSLCLRWVFRAPNAPREKQAVLNYYQGSYDANLARRVANNMVGTNLGSYSLTAIGKDYMVSIA